MTDEKENGWRVLLKTLLTNSSSLNNFLKKWESPFSSCSQVFLVSFPQSVLVSREKHSLRKKRRDKHERRINLTNLFGSNHRKEREREEKSRKHSSDLRVKDNWVLPLNPLLPSFILCFLPQDPTDEEGLVSHTVKDLQEYPSLQKS